MELKNYQEEMVRAVLPLVLEDHSDLAKDEAFVHDVAAYVLNRLPPRYIMSERGLSRIAADHWLLDPDEPKPRRKDTRDPALVGMIQLLILVNRAIHVVGSRRRDGPAGRPHMEARGVNLGLEGEYWHNFPQIIGRVVDARTRAPISGVTVTLSTGRLGVLASERGWSNPSQTTEGAKGYFSLWPQALRDGALTKTITLRFVFEHPAYQPATRPVRYRSRGEIIPGAELRLDRILNLGSQALVPRRKVRA